MRNENEVFGVIKMGFFSSTFKFEIVDVLSPSKKGRLVVMRVLVTTEIFAIHLLMNRNAYTMTLVALCTLENFLSISLQSNRACSHFSAISESDRTKISCMGTIVRKELKMIAIAHVAIAFLLASENMIILASLISLTIFSQLELFPVGHRLTPTAGILSVWLPCLLKVKNNVVGSYRFSSPKVFPIPLGSLNILFVR
uniref:7TM_GPCR_Srx domain-containing protein n=1 Tax=Heterorhabditis bacteriophora TaxID=37862 RepID=A0A1I7X0K3_HETBA